MADIIGSHDLFNGEIRTDRQKLRFIGITDR